MRKKLVIQSGARTNSIGNSIRNKILLWIPDNEYLIIRPHLEYLKLPSRLSLRESSEPVKFLYFPNAGLISLIVTMHDGRTVEAGVIGREGALGVALAVGLNKCPVGEKVQIAGDGFKVRASVVQNILKSTPQLLMVLNEMVAESPGSSRLFLTCGDSRLSRDNARNKSAHRQQRSRHSAKEKVHRIHARRSEDPRPPKTRSFVLRVLRGHETVRQGTHPQLDHTSECPARDRHADSSRVEWLCTER